MCFKFSAQLQRLWGMESDRKSFLGWLLVSHFPFQLVFSFSIFSVIIIILSNTEETFCLNPWVNFFVFLNLGETFVFHKARRERDLHFVLHILYCGALFDLNIRTFTSLCERPIVCKNGGGGLMEPKCSVWRGNGPQQKIWLKRSTRDEIFTARSDF